MAPKKSDRKWSLVERSRNVHSINVNLSGRQDGATFLLVSDVHWDNPHCDRNLLKRHFDEAVANDCPIISVGDFFCAMQGKYDKRSDKSDVRPEHQRGDYLDRLVDTAAEWFYPYRNHLAVMGVGNHETSVKSRHETCLLDRLCGKIRDKGGITRLGGYAGWVRLQFHRAGRPANSLNIWYHHGFGGGGPVTQGKIDFNRYGSYVDADVIACGHVHYKECFPVTRAYLSQQSIPSTRTMYCVRLGTYKDEWQDGHGGFHIEKGRGPRPLGGYWMKLGMDRSDSETSRLAVEFRDAGQL